MSVLHISRPIHLGQKCLWVHACFECVWPSSSNRKLCGDSTGISIQRSPGIRQTVKPDDRAREGSLCYVNLHLLLLIHYLNPYSLKSNAKQSKLKAKQSSSLINQIMGWSEHHRVQHWPWVGIGKKRSLIGIKCLVKRAEASSENFLIIHLTFQHLLLCASELPAGDKDVPLCTLTTASCQACRMWALYEPAY